MATKKGGLGKGLDSLITDKVGTKPGEKKTVVEDANREKYTATMEKTLRRRVKVACAQEGLLFSAFIEQACLEKLEREGR